MGKLRKIALLMCASNFERQRRVVRDVHKALQEMGTMRFMYLLITVCFMEIPRIMGAQSPFIS